jgi:RHS repeat-associated protein
LITDSFDDLGEVTQSVRAYTGVSSNTLTYSRYPDGTRSAMTVEGNTLDYYYDADGRYTSMTSPVGTSYASYYDNGWQSSRTLPNGIVSAYDYNPVGALTSLTSTLSGSTLSSFSSFSYDGVFNMTGFSGTYGSGSSWPNGSRTFGYDSKDRLTGSSIPTSGSSTTSSTFGFDSAGNRTSVNSTTIPFNSDNQLSSTGYSFDGNGNPTTYGGTSLTFDPENRMTAFGSTSSATYRADGLRASKTTSAGTTYFLYDGAEPIVEMNSSGTVTATNVFAPDGLVARQTSSATTEYVFDEQGNVADRTNTSGVIQSVTQYDAWGNEQDVSGTPMDPFGFNARWGYYFDRETGVYLCQHRFYDPANGRWLNRDPIGYNGGADLYSYCAGAPANEFDTTGFIKVTGLPFTLDQCRKLQQEIDDYIDRMENELQNYNSDTDSQGGVDSNGRPWQPWAHAGRYEDMQAKLRKMEERMDNRCPPGSRSPSPSWTYDPIREAANDCPDAANQPMDAPDPLAPPMPSPGIPGTPPLVPLPVNPPGGAPMPNLIPEGFPVEL